MKLDRDAFIRLILDGVSPTPAPAPGPSPAPRPGRLAALQRARQQVDAPVAAVAEPFARRLLRELGFGPGDAIARDEVIGGDQKTSRFLPGHVTRWAKTTERPYHIVLVELTSTGRALLDDPFFRQRDTLEDALLRLAQDILNGFERRSGHERGTQAETLCVVSIADDRGDRSGPEQARHLLCFATHCTTTNALEAFTLREEARDWAERGDRPLAEEHLGQLFDRHFKPLFGGEGWQAAFASKDEVKKVDELIAAARRDELTGNAEHTLQSKILNVLDEIARSFGIKRRKADGDSRLAMVKLPSSHSIGVDPDEARRDGFVNPRHGVRIYDPAKRLLGFIVYHPRDPGEREQLRADLRAHNRFHNVLVIYPHATQPEFELWQGPDPLRGRLLAGPNRARFDGPGGIVQLISRFFVVSKSAIEKPAQLAAELAWRAQDLRAIARKELEQENTRGKGPLKEIFDILNESLATLSVGQFADAYAQTITYGMLAARWISSDRQDLLFTRQNLPALLPSTSPFLRDLFQKLVNSNFDENLSWLLDDTTSLLARTSVAQVFLGERDPSIHFYQDFLDAYDPQIRKEQGVYYTPDEVVSYIVRTAHSALQHDFGLPLGLADTTAWADFAAAKQISVPKGIDPRAPFVQVLDPALGTGTFLLRVIEVIHETMEAEYERRGLTSEAARSQWIAYVRRDLLPRINGFELMMAPYIVSHLRLGLALQRTGFVFEQGDRLRVYLTNTLEMHTPTQLSTIGEHVAAEATEAERVKKDAAISVILGNPPYEREPAESAGKHKGGWVRSGWDGWRDRRPPLEDFAEPTRKAGRGGDLKNIYNLYVYFWRWAMWRVFDRYAAPGIVSFITASSYLRGPGFVGMREEMRRAAGQIYVLDLEGDQKGARRNDNIFNILIAVAIATLRALQPSERNSAAPGHYVRVDGTTAEKLAYCARQAVGVNAAGHRTAMNWDGALVSSRETLFSTLPLVADIFPWQHSGAQYKRKWPIGATQQQLETRWRALLSCTGRNRAEAFRETGAWTISSTFKPLLLDGDIKPPLNSLGPDAPLPRLTRYGYRSFDRQYAIADERFGDRLRPPLWQSWSRQQLYLACLLSKVLGDGPAMTASAYVPDLDFFCNRGGKDVIPLWRDPAAQAPNIAAGFIARLKATHGKAPRPQDIFAYAYAVLANPGYVTRFEEELQIPGPRLPVTKDKALFARGAALGRELLRWHTYGERFREKGDGFALAGTAKVITAIPSAPAKYPEKHTYDEATQRLRVGDGEIGPVSPEVWRFSVSGLQVVKSWLDYRMKKGAGKKSSPLDDIRPERWTDEMTRELLELLWVLEWSLARYQTLDAWLDEVLDGDLFTAEEIPPPTDAERKEPKVQRNIQPNLPGTDDE
ncbi:MAG: type ISP restriction/modification enzyme [bacterium]